MKKKTAWGFWDRITKRWRIICLATPTREEAETAFESHYSHLGRSFYELEKVTIDLASNDLGKHLKKWISEKRAEVVEERKTNGRDREISLRCEGIEETFDALEEFLKALKKKQKESGTSVKRKNKSEKLN